MNRILFCSPFQKTKELGGSKVVVELAEAMGEIGWDCHILSSSDVSVPSNVDGLTGFRDILCQHLKSHAADYDIIDYDHMYLPYPRQEFGGETLFVARSVLLGQHLDTIPIPKSSGVRAIAGRIFLGRKRQRRERQIVHQAQLTVEQADLVNVSNYDDKAELMRRGIAENKILVIPYGISRLRRPLFDQVSSELPPQPMVTFVGTFDYRKGAKEFPRIVQGIVDKVPAAKFRLLGVGGMFSTEQAIRRHFPQKLQSRLEIVLKYKSEELPSLLSSCSIGIFPSHMEGFGFGILEMLAASVPVVAYDAPGPPMMLPKEYLVPRGDYTAMSNKVAEFLDDDAKLASARIWAKQRSRDFDWSEIAKATSEVYLTALAKRRPSSEDAITSLSERGI